MEILACGGGPTIYWLSLIELLAAQRSRVSMAHLHHHTRYPHDDDIEGAAAKMSLMRTIAEGVVFQFRIWCWAVKHAERERRIIIGEGIGCITLVLLAIATSPLTPVFLVYSRS